MEFFFRSELREFVRYFVIFKVIVFGKMKFGEIVSFIGFLGLIVLKYFSNL